MAILSTPVRTWKTVKAHHFIAGGLAVLVAALAATGSWRLADSGGTASVQRVPVAVVSHSVTTSAPAPVFYLVSSEDQKDALVSAIGAQEIDSRALGDFEIIVAPDAETVNRATQMVVDQNAILFSNGLPEMKIVDLRQPAEEAPAPATGGPHFAEPGTLHGGVEY